MESDDGPLCQLFLRTKGRTTKVFKEVLAHLKTFWTKEQNCWENHRVMKLQWELFMGRVGACGADGTYSHFLKRGRTRFKRVASSFLLLKTVFSWKQAISDGSLLPFVAKTVFLKTGNIRWVASSSFAKNSFPENKQLPIFKRQRVSVLPKTKKT